MKNILYSMLRIINHDNRIKITNQSKVIHKSKKRKLKNGTTSEYHFYQFSIPDPFLEYIHADGKVYAYEDDGKCYLSGSEPEDLFNYKELKVQASRQVSLPRDFFPSVTADDEIVLKLDFERFDKYSGRKGLLSLKLK